MRMLRALFNFARENYKDGKNQSLYLHNPVEILSRLKSWYYVGRKTTVIKQHQLKPVFWAMMEIRTERIEPYTFRDYLLMCLFTGLRRQEIASLRIDQIDLEERSILLKGETVKNRQDHLVPLNTFIYDIIQSRIDRLNHYTIHSTNSENAEKTPAYLFPTPSKSGYFAEPRATCDPVVKKLRALSLVRTICGTRLSHWQKAWIFRPMPGSSWSTIRSRIMMFPAAT
jgi:integrase